MRLFFVSVLLMMNIAVLAQEMSKDSLSQPLISIEKKGLLENIHINFGMRLSFRTYSFRGGDHDYQGAEFENEYTALEIGGKIHKKVKFHFRNRFNKGTEVQTLDQLGSNIELAYIDVQATPKLNIHLGKQFAYFGGYEYEFNAMDVLEYNDIQSNALAYVTGIGLTYDITKKHSFGFQVLNSRTMHYDDLYGDQAAEYIHEPDWPVAFVGRWIGNFLDGKLQTNYSYSYNRQVKNKGTHFFTLGHKYHYKKLTLMYDFDYSFEEIDTKGVASGIIGAENIGQNVTYIENWLRGEYQFSPQFRGLLTLMTSSASGNNLKSQHEGRDHLRTSYGAIPTLYYSPFENIDIRFFLAYIGRYYDYSQFAKDNLGATNYNKNEIRFGFIAPFNLL